MKYREITMFNRHQSLSHPLPVHRSEETGLHNFRLVQNEFWQFLLLALVQHTLSYLARLSAVGQAKINSTHTDRHIVYYFTQ